MGDSISINVKVNLTDFHAIKDFITDDNADTEIIKEFLKEVYDLTYTKAAHLEALGNNFVNS